MRITGFEVKKWPLRKRIVSKLVQAFEWGDYEYLRGEVGRWPFKLYLTVYEPRMCGSWHRKLFPWRIRTSLAPLLWNVTYRRCTRCGSGFMLRELLAGNRDLNFYPSGSICHKDCEPSEFFKEMTRRNTIHG